jgi:hypothetical protein
MPEKAAEPPIRPLRAFKLLRSEEYPAFAVLALSTPDGAQRFAVTREILETLSTNMTQAASKMPEPKAAPKKA